MTEKYSHTPLRDPRSIRLIRLKPRKSRSSGEEILECELVVRSLDDRLTFSAVSYSWDSQTATSSATCDGKLLSITENCEAALRQVALNGSRRLLWVDSVCIDQTNIKERSHQVTLMAEIYKRAKNVLVWLGESDGDSDLAMKTLAELSRVVKIFPKFVAWKFKKIRRFRRIEILSSFEMADIWSACLPDNHLQGLHPMYPIAARSWFGRIWTLQEIVLAKKAVVLCGGRSISWNNLSHVADMISQADASSGFTQYPGDEFQRVRVVSMLRSLLGVGPPYRDVSYRLPSDHPFASLKMCLPEDYVPAPLGIATHYYLASSLLSSDPKDRVYGLYAILQQYGVSLPPPDYNKASSTIYRETARAIIERDSSLELLYYVSCPRGLTGLPSWVPDSSDFFPWVPGFEYTIAAGKSASRFKFDKEGKLSIFGLQIDTVKSRASVLRMSQALEHVNIRDEQAFLRVYRSVVRTLQEWIRFSFVSGDCSGESPLDTLCMVLLQEVAFAFVADQNAWTKFRDFFRIWTEAILRISLLNDAPGLNAHLTRHEKPSPGVSEVHLDGEDFRADRDLYMKIAQQDTTKTVHHTVITRADGNCLFSTGSGRLGLATTEIKEGDQIALISGMRLPMVMRESEGRYTLIGAAYIHGVMQGELWPVDQTLLKEFKII